MIDCVGFEVGIGQIVKIPQHPSNCFVHSINEADNFAIIENYLGYFIRIHAKEIRVLEQNVLPEEFRCKD